MHVLLRLLFRLQNCCLNVCCDDFTSLISKVRRLQGFLFQFALALASQLLLFLIYDNSLSFSFSLHYVLGLFLSCYLLLCFTIAQNLAILYDG